MSRPDAQKDVLMKKVNNVWLMDVDDLVIALEENGRRKTTLSADFIQSMMTGQNTPVKVRPVRIAGEKKWKLAFGYRRALAIQHINKEGLLPEPMQIMVQVDDQLNDETAFLQNVRENKDRQDCTALDNAVNMGRLKDIYHWSDKKIAEFYGKTDAWVCKTRKLLQLDAKFQDLIDERVITAAQAEKLVDCDEQFRESLYAQIKADGFCNFSAGDILRQARAEGATDTTRNAALKPKEIRAFFEELAEESEETETPPYVREFAKITCKWLNGAARMGNNKYYAELADRLKSRI